MHSFEKKVLSSHFNQYFKSPETIYNVPTRLATSNNFFLPRGSSSRAMFPQVHCAQAIVRKTWPGPDLLI